MAITLQRRIGRPVQRRFESILENNFINNRPVTLDDSKRAGYIFGDDPAILKGKITRERQQHVPSIPRVMIPSIGVSQRCHFMYGFLFCSRKPIFTFNIKEKNFFTVTPTKKRGKETIMTTLNGTNNMYSGIGVKSDTILADKEFECIRDEVFTISLNIAAAE